jgi:phosphate transport system protein
MTPTDHADPPSPAPGSSQRDQIQRSVLHLFAMVSEGLAEATQSFLAGDRDSARRLVADDPLIDELQASIEQLVQRELDRPVTRPEEIRLLVSVLRIVPELERSGDLVEHIALRTRPGLLSELTPRARGLIAEMGRLGVTMWTDAANAWRAEDPTAAIRLRQLDDRIDDLHVQLTGELAESPMPTAAAIELGLVARFFERLGDHAVNVARRIEYLALPAGPS